jgi:hypothetical protein
MIQPCCCVIPIELLRNGRKWNTVVGDSDTVGISSGIQIKLEYSGEGLGPIAGDFDQVVIYGSTRPGGEEIARYDLANIHRPDCLEGVEA